MHPSELEVGALDAVQFPLDQPRDELRAGAVLTFRWSPSAQAYQLLVPGLVAEVGPLSPRLETQLGRLLQRGNYIAWVAAASDRDVVVGVRQFAAGFVSAQPLEMILTDDVIRDIADRAGVARPRVPDWLKEEFLLPTSAGAADDMSRVVVSAVPAQASGGARIFGRASALDLQITTSQTVIRRFVQRPGRGDVAMTLLEAPVRFVDASGAGLFAREGRNELEVIVREASSYLGLWDRYNDVEARHVRTRLAEIGTARFDKIELRDDGLTVQLGEEADGFLEAILDHEGLVELSAEAPHALSDDPDVSLLSDFADALSIAVQATGVDSRRRRLRVRVDEGIDLDTLDIPPRGFVFPSVRGDRTRLMRRREARERIARGEAAIPQIGLILEGRPAAIAARARRLKLSAAARACFNGEPTSAQQRALEVAMATPDIALIQGPPGTGKTQVIAALQALIAEQAGEQAGANHRILLTSYQHDAVENATARTRVFGLPPVRIASRRHAGAADPVDTWRHTLRNELEMDLAATDPGGVALLREAERWVRSYQVEPLDDASTERLLRTVRDLATGWLSRETLTRLEQVEASVRESARRRSMAESHLAVRALRGLPATLEALRDDGTWRIDKALQLANAALLLDEDESSRMRALRDAPPSEDVVVELAELKATLLERATSSPELAAHGEVNPDVLQLLVDVTRELEAAIRQGRDGAALAIEHFAEALELDPWGARDAVRHYTAVLASTVQQAVAPRMLSAKGVESVSDLRFDTVVVDEAARANPLDLMIPMSLGERRVVLVGDHKQLPQVLEPSIERELGDTGQDARSALEMSLFERLLRLMRDDEGRTGVTRVVTLDAQFRMHPVLGDFVSDAFYLDDGGIRSPRGAEDFIHGLPGYGDLPATWIDIPMARGSEVRRGTGRVRPVEAERIAEELEQCLRSGPNTHTFGVIAFYRAQVREIWRALGRRGLARETEDGEWEFVHGTAGIGVGGAPLGDRVRLGTVDSFQGMEFDVVLLSTTRSNDVGTDEPRKKYGFLCLANRLCVAMSRQERLLIAFGDQAMYRPPEAAESVPGLVKFLVLAERLGGVVHA